MSCRKENEGRVQTRTPIRLLLHYEPTPGEELVEALALLAEAHLRQAREGVPTKALAFQRQDQLNETDETGVAAPISS